MGLNPLPLRPLFLKGCVLWLRRGTGNYYGSGQRTDFQSREGYETTPPVRSPGQRASLWKGMPANRGLLPH